MYAFLVYRCFHVSQGKFGCKAMILERGPEIGRGAYGKVFATKGSWVVKVAIPNHEKTLRNEADMIGRLKPHKHIPDVEILNKVKLGTEMYSVILYMPHYGDSLYNIFTQHKNPPFERTVAILKEFLEQTRKIFEHLCECGVMHRDIASRNILFNGIFILIDYGQAKHYDKKFFDEKPYEYREEVIRWYRVRTELRDYVEKPQCIKFRRDPKEQDENDGDKLFEVMEEMWRKPEIVSCDISFMRPTRWMYVLTSDLDNVKAANTIKVDVVNVTEDGNLLVEIDKQMYVFKINRETPPVAEFDSIAQGKRKATKDAVLTCFKKKRVLGTVTSFKPVAKRMCGELDE